MLGCRLIKLGIINQIMNGADLGQSFYNACRREEGLMVPIFATSTQANLLIYLGGGSFVLLGAFYFGRLVTFFFPKNPLIRKGKEKNDA